MTGAVARRYAKAVFALAKEAGTLQPTADQLARLAAVARDPTVGPVLRSPLLSATRRQDLAQTLSRELTLSELLTHFIQLLADHQRLRELPAIADRYQQLLDTELGRVPRDHPQRQPAGRQTGSRHRRRLRAADRQSRSSPTSVVDTELLGGVVVEVVGKVYDGSVRTQLDRLAKELSGAASL